MPFRCLVIIAVNALPDAQRCFTVGRNKRGFVDKSTTPFISINVKASASRSASEKGPDPVLMKPWTSTWLRRCSLVVAMLGTGVGGRAGGRSGDVGDGGGRNGGRKGGGDGDAGSDGGGN